jgi:hypothetical protein
LTGVDLLLLLLLLTVLPPVLGQVQGGLLLLGQQVTFLLLPCGCCSSGIACTAIAGVWTVGPTVLLLQASRLCCVLTIR